MGHCPVPYPVAYAMAYERAGVLGRATWSNAWASGIRACMWPERWGVQHITHNIFVMSEATLWERSSPLMTRRLYGHYQRFGAAQISVYDTVLMEVISKSFTRQKRL